MAYHPQNTQNSRYSTKKYDDRFHRMMFPMDQDTIPKQRNYLATNDIPGAVPGSNMSKLKQINGRDYMDIKDIPGVKPKPNFLLYKSQHKDYKLDINDIPGANHNKSLGIGHDPLNPQYVRLTNSRRHVQVLGDIEGNKPKQAIAPKTRRRTNMIDDIEGAKPTKPRHNYYGKKVDLDKWEESLKHREIINPINGTSYVVHTDFKKRDQFANKGDERENKSRRLLKIMDNVKSRDNFAQRSRSSFQPNYPHNSPSNSPNNMNPVDVSQRLSSKRKQLENAPNSKRHDMSVQYTSKDLKGVELPPFSKRKIGRERPSMDRKLSEKAIYYFVWLLRYKNLYYSIRRQK